MATRNEAEVDATGGGQAAEPLAGLSVLVPRAPEQAEALSARIRALGGEPVEAPTIEIRPGDRDRLVAALQGVARGEYTAVCVTSPNGVRAVAAALDDAGLDAQVFAEVQLAAIGPGTARTLRAELGVRPDLVPDTSTTAALGAALPNGAGRVLLPRADIASAILPEVLTERGYDPVTVDAYVTVLPEDLPPGVAGRLADGQIDLIAFTSSSTVRNFVELMEGRSWTATVVSIGPVTTATCREFDIEVAVEADDHDLDGVVAALVRAAEHRGAEPT